MYQGLTTIEARKLLQKYGPNKISRPSTHRWLKILWQQIDSPLLLVLVGAALVSFLVEYFSGGGEFIDSVLILVIVLLSVIAGFIQDYKAERTMDALVELAQGEILVIRSGKEVKISIEELVPGDIIILADGDIVPADASLLEAHYFSCDESILTGETRAVTKQEGDIVYKGTAVQVGRGIARVIATGKRTKLGEIAAALQTIETGSGVFERELKHLSAFFLKLIGIIVAIIFVVGMVRFDFWQAFLLAIALAVAAIPEGLPAVLTVVLAMGAHAMAKRKALVRKLSAVEAMGEVDVICTDKTGTLTRNEMSAVSLWQRGEVIDVHGLSQPLPAGIRQLILAGWLCNDVRISQDKQGRPLYYGEQTEVALVKLAQPLTAEQFSQFKRLDERPFSAERKMMSVLVEDKSGSLFTFVKGAPEMLIEKCQQQLDKKGQIIKWDKAGRQAALKQYQHFANQALRVIACAFKPLDSPADFKEENLIWLGMIALMDPPRPEAAAALVETKKAGIRTIMLTGDYAGTARAIAKMVGLETKGIISGRELEQMSDDKLLAQLDEGVNIFARISPFHKLRILKLLQRRYHSVAMTGDGVNDALALKQADIGIAMGIKGTEVAKQASDIILLNDNFATIRDAVREGRRSLDNISKFVNYLAVSNLAEVGVIFVSTLFFALREPILLPVHILWINLITDGIPALALGLDPARPQIMRQPPRAGKPLIDKRLRWIIGAIGLKKMVVLLVTFLILLPAGLPIARTALFTGFILYEFVRIASIRAQEKLRWLDNKWLIAALLVSLLLQLIIIYSPLNHFFQVVPLGIYPWIVLLLGVLVGYFSALFITRLIDKRFKNEVLVR